MQTLYRHYRLKAVVTDYYLQLIKNNDNNLMDSRVRSDVLKFRDRERRKFCALFLRNAPPCRFG